MKEAKLSDFYTSLLYLVRKIFIPLCPIFTLALPQNYEILIAITIHFPINSPKSLRELDTYPTKISLTGSSHLLQLYSAKNLFY